MFCEALNASLTPRSPAVPGIIYIRPCAPLFDRAIGLNADSAWITARRSALSTPVDNAAAAISFLNASRLSAVRAKSIFEWTSHATHVAMYVKSTANEAPVEGFTFVY